MPRGQVPADVRALERAPEVIDLTTAAAPTSGVDQAPMSTLPRPPAGSHTRFAAVVRRFQSSINRSADAVALGTAVLVLDTTLVSVLYALCALVALSLNDPKHLRLSPRISEDLWILVGRLAIPVLLLAPLGAVRGTSSWSLSQVFVLSAVLVLVGRAAAYGFQRRLRRNGTLGAATLVVGAGPLGQKLGRTLKEHPEYGLRVVGYVDHEPPPGIAAEVIGSPADLSETLHRYDIERVVVAYGAMSGARMVPILRACDERDVAVYHVPRFFELGVLTNSTEHEDVWGVPLIRFRRAGLRRSARWIKRSMDLVLTGGACLVLAPVFAVLAVAVRVTSPGPVLFRQIRVGQDGREFELLKFRTMEVNDDSNVQWSVAGDRRLTPIGGFLRRSSLDELPQLLNILRGDMSLVGPRPERPYFVQQFGSEHDGYHDRHRVPVGLTGWSQVHGLRGDTSIEERVRLDNHYIENWSPWLDVVIIARTLRALGTGA